MWWMIQIAFTLLSISIVNTLYCAFRSADIADCVLFVVRNDAESAQCRGEAYEDKIYRGLSYLIYWLDKYNIEWLVPMNKHIKI